MSGPAELLRQIPDDYKLATGIILGSIILVCLVLFHGMGIHWVTSIHKRADCRLRAERPHIFAALLLFGVVIFLFLTLHIIGVIWWAVVLRNLGLIRTAKDAIYFCANAYTTLGYGPVDLDPGYRIISPIIGISGLFTFAWTTSALVNLVRDHNALLETLERERVEEKLLRGNLRLAIRDAREHEREAETAARHTAIATTPDEPASASFLRHCRLWRDERQQLKAIRKGFRTEKNVLDHQERDAENNLGVANSDASQPTTKPTPPPKP